MKTRISCALVAVLAIGCGQSGVGGACTTCPNPAIAISISTGSLTIVQGGNGNLNATITRTGGFTGAVTIVTTGAPAGVSGTASNIITTGNVISGTVTVSVAGTVAPGTYNLTVQATGPGVATVTQGFTLTVTGASALGVALSAAAQGVDQGTTGAAVTMTITRTNFPGVVTLTVEGAPAGIVPVLNPPTTSGNTASFTLQVGAAVPAGSYSLTIRAAGAGVTDATVPFALTVTVPADFSISLSPPALSVSQGTSFGTTVTITRTGAGIGPVALTATNLPAGVTVSFVPATVTGTTSIATFFVAPTAVGGTFSFSITGTAGGISRSATMQITVPPLAAGTLVQLGGALDVGPVGGGARDLFAAGALDLSGNPVVAWKGRVVGPGTSTNYIHVKRWDGANWVQLGGSLRLGSTRNGGLYDTPSIDVDPSTGNPVVAWSEESSRTPIGSLVGAFDVYVKRWNGSAWVQLGGALNVDPAAGAVYPKIRITSTGMPIVAWWETPHHTAVKYWNGGAWVGFGGQQSVTTGAQDVFLTSLTIDSADNPFLVFGVSGGPFAARGSATGWTMLGNGSARTSPAPAYAWSAAIDASGQLTVLFLTRDVTSIAADATALRVRRIEGGVPGVWADFGAPVLTADRNTVPGHLAIAIPFGTSAPIVSVAFGGPNGNPPGLFAQTFWQGGTIWQQFAQNPCELAVRANASTVSTAAPVIVCVRSAGDEDIVAYRLMP